MSSDEEVKASKGKNMNKVLIILLAITLAAGGYMFMKPDSEAAAKPAPKEGEVLAADPIHINLADGHFLKVGIALQVIDAPQGEVEASKALDSTISLFSGREIKELEDSKKREKLKDQLTEILKERYKEDVMSVYFTEFVVQ